MVYINVNMKFVGWGDEGAVNMRWKAIQCFLDTLSTTAVEEPFIRVESVLNCTCK